MSIQSSSTATEMKKLIGQDIQVRMKENNNLLKGKLLLKNGTELVLCDNENIYTIKPEDIKEYTIIKAPMSPKRKRLTTAHSTESLQEESKISPKAVKELKDDVMEAMKQSKQQQSKVEQEVLKTIQEVNLRSSETNHLLGRVEAIEATMKNNHDVMVNSIHTLSAKMGANNSAVFNDQGLIAASKLLDVEHWPELAASHTILSLRIQLREHFSKLLTQGARTRREAELALERLERSYDYIKRALAEGAFHGIDFAKNEAKFTIERLTAMSFGLSRGPGGIEVKKSVTYPDYV